MTSAHQMKDPFLAGARCKMRSAREAQRRNADNDNF